MKQHRALRLSALATAATLAGGAQAFGIETDNPDWALRWDNSVRLSAKFRTESADPALTDSTRQVPTGAAAPAPATTSFSQALNFNAGDQNFQDPGLVSARVDLLSEFDAIWRRDFGVRLSAAAWYDDKLHRKTQADNDSSIGQSPYNEFPSKTKKLAGGKAELLDAFVFGGWRFDNGTRLTARLGRHALQYGESLFFGDNGIARAQGPSDVDKLLASPNAQFKETVRPVPQLSAQLQLTPEISIGGYLQFRWEADRLPSSGSYFSAVNIGWGSQQPEFVNIPAGTPISGSYMLSAAADQKPKDSGQFGLQLRWRLDETDLGFYFARYHDKTGQIYGNLNPNGTPNAAGLLPGSWFYLFPESVKTAGASVSHSFGDVNLAAETSIRDDVPLWSANRIYAGGAGAAQPRPALGRTVHLNISTLANFGPNVIARESSLAAEIAWNRLLSKDDPDNSLDAGRTRDAIALQFTFTPSYRQAFAGVDLSLPIGLRYMVDGHSAVTGAGWGGKGTGAANIGVEGSYLSVWQFALNYTHYIGKAVPFVDYTPLLSGGSSIYSHGNTLADRNYVAVSLRRTF
jgi:Protein of unknown function (DUF1302)